jgi:hypothetical protein
MSTASSSKTLLLHARREALIVIIVWAMALVWTVGYCYLRGYDHPADSWLVQQGWAVAEAESQASLFGFPSWVLFGILIPWMLCSLFTVFFGFFGIRDDDLGQEREEAGHA